VWIKWIGTHKNYDKVDVIRCDKECRMAGEVKPIRTKRDYEASLKEVERLWGAKAGTRDGDRLDLLATLIDDYEAEHYPMDPLDPIKAHQ